MRTPTQIQNLRQVFLMSYGPIAMFASDTVIDEMADKIQQSIDNLPQFWCVKVRMIDNPDQKWKDIEPEPNNPHCGMVKMVKKCDELIGKYPKITAIEISIVGSVGDRYLIERK